jgi:hypothetical protein
MERFLVTSTISYPDVTPWGHGIDLEDEKTYIHSRYGAGPRYFGGLVFLWFELQFALHLARACIKNRYRAVVVGRHGLLFPTLARLLRLKQGCDDGCRVPPSSFQPHLRVRLAKS